MDIHISIMKDGMKLNEKVTLLVAPSACGMVWATGVDIGAPLLFIPHLPQVL